jgi:predicted deacylase
MLAPCRARESGGQYTEPCWIGAKSRARTSCEEEKAETHSKQETDRAPVDLDVRQEVRVPLEQAERREVGLVKVLEEQGLAVEGVDRTPVVAVSAV